jgi:hypothetical protein
MRFIVSIIIYMTVAVLNVSCGDADCSGAACAGIGQPDDIKNTPSLEWGGAAASTTDCGNGGGVAEVDNTTLFFSEEKAADTPHNAIAMGGSVHVNGPILVWRAICNKSSGTSDALTVNWARAACQQPGADCATPVDIGSSLIPAQHNCSCTVAFVEDVVGDQPGEVAGFYLYTLSLSGTELANAKVIIEN